MKKTVQYIIDVAGNASDMLGKIGREAASLGEGKLQWSFPIAIAENGTPRGAGGALSTAPKKSLTFWDGSRVVYEHF